MRDERGMTDFELEGEAEDRLMVTDQPAPLEEAAGPGAEPPVEWHTDYIADPVDHAEAWTHGDETDDGPEAGTEPSA